MKFTGFFRTGGARPPTEEMIEFIDENRGEYGVESNCRVLSIAPATYHRVLTERREPERRCQRAKRDEELRHKIEAAWASSRGVYGHRKVWDLLRRDDRFVARRTVQRLMRDTGLQGVARGKLSTHYPALRPD